MRVKRGHAKKQRHKRILASTKGYRMSYSKLYKRAREAVLHAGQYAFAHRRRRQSQYRNLWIKRINAALSETDMKYNTFINALKTKNVELDRRVLASMALDYPESFKAVVDFVK